MFGLQKLRTKFKKRAGRKTHMVWVHLQEMSQEAQIYRDADQWMPGAGGGAKAVCSGCEESLFGDGNL